MSDHNPPLPKTHQANDELFDRDTFNDSDNEFLAELDRVLAAEPSPPREPSDQNAYSPEDAPAAAPADGDDFPQDDDHVSVAPESGWNDPTDLAEVGRAEESPSAPSNEASREADTIIGQRSRKALDTLLELGAKLDAEPPPSASSATTRRESLTETEVRTEHPPAENISRVPSPATPTPSTSVPHEPTKKELNSFLVGVDNPGIWDKAAMLLALIGIILSGTGIWWIGTFGDRLSHLEMTSQLAASSTPMSSETGNAPSLEIVQRKLGHLSAGLEQVRAHLPDPLAQQQQDAEAVDALKAHLTQLDTQLKALQDTVAGTDQRLRRVERQVTEPPRSENQRTSIARIQEAQAAQPENQSPTPTPSKAGSKAVSRVRVPSPSKAAQTDRPNPSTWTVNLFSFRHKKAAEQALARLKTEQQIPGHVTSVTHGDQTWYRVVVAGFSDFDSAKAYADEVRVKPGLASAWIGRD